MLIPAIPRNLRCESLVSPLSIDSVPPHLSWMISSERRGQAQSAYQILVASDLSVLRPGVADLWDSGKVSGSESAQIPVVFDGVRNGETYDARLERPGWANPGYDDSDWKNAYVVAGPGGVLTAQLLPTKVMATITPVSVTELDSDVTVVDLGQNIAGWAGMVAEARVGTELTLRYGEKLGTDGKIDVSTPEGHAPAINQFIESGDFQTDRYTFKG